MLRLSLRLGLSLCLALGRRLRLHASLASNRGSLPSGPRSCIDLMSPLFWAEAASAPQAVRAGPPTTAAAHGHRGQPFFSRCLRRSLPHLVASGMALNCHSRMGCCRGLRPEGPPYVLGLRQPPFLQMPASRLRVERRNGMPQRFQPF